MKEKQNGTHTAANTAPADKKPIANGSTPHAPLVVEFVKPIATPEDVARERLAKKVKLDTLYEDIEQLEEAAREFDSIQSYGEITVIIQCGGSTRFKTSRQDTVVVGLEALGTSIKAKLALAYRQLGDFQF